MVLHRLPGDRGSQAEKEAGSREQEASNPWRCGGVRGATELRFPCSESLTGFTKPLLRRCADAVLPRQAPAPAAQGTGTHPLLSVRSWSPPQGRLLLPRGDEPPHGQAGDMPQFPAHAPPAPVLSQLCVLPSLATWSKSHLPRKAFPEDFCSQHLAFSAHHSHYFIHSSEQPVR